MSSGFKGKFHRQNVLSRFAKDLVRRSRSHCELCANKGVRLNPMEVLPLEEEPYLDGTVFICETCQEQIEKPKRMESAHWRCLNDALWSEVPVVQVLSVRLLRRLQKKDNHFWAEELLEHAYLDIEIEEWADLAE